LIPFKTCWDFSKGEKKSRHKIIIMADDNRAADGERISDADEKKVVEEP
jgi:hypothetical protein